MDPHTGSIRRQADDREDREGLSTLPEAMSVGEVTIADLINAADYDDDIEFNPSSRSSETTDSAQEDQEDEDDGDDENGDVHIQFSFSDRDEGAPDNEQGNAPAQHLNDAPSVTVAELLEVLPTNASFRQLLARLINGRSIPTGERGDDPENDGSGHRGSRSRRPRRSTTYQDRLPKIPSDEGRALMKSGTYGVRDHFTDARWQRKKNISQRLLWRQLGMEPRGSHRQESHLLSQDMIPSSNVADRIIHYDSRAYSGQFSDDGNFFFSCTQNFKVRMYDTSNPYEWKYYKTVDYPFGQWTITDASLSPDNRWLAYSSIRHIVCLAPTDPSGPADPTLLDFTNFAPSAGNGSRRVTDRWGRSGFGIWSLRFSGDGREIVAGTSDHTVVVYDLETQQSVLKLGNHEDDVNAVCFGDTSSPHILYSGSDDQTLRVWDRRSMGDGREAGVFIGHTEGLTYVDSKGDGRYVLSNAKDQTMKLWDLRKMMDPNKLEGVNLRHYSTNFDYRFNTYDPIDYNPNPHDCSVVTFRGHSILRTLIRCHFSPAISSNSRYVYSGSEDGHVWIWNMDGTVRATLNVKGSTFDSRPPLPESRNHGYGWHQNSNSWETLVRDASWHPNAPMIAATSWNGWNMTHGTVSVHSWNAGVEVDDDDEDEEGQGKCDSRPSKNFNARLNTDEAFDEHSRETRQRRSRRNRG